MVEKLSSGCPLQIRIDNRRFLFSTMLPDINGDDRISEEQGPTAALDHQNQGVHDFKSYRRLLSRLCSLGIYGASS